MTVLLVIGILIALGGAGGYFYAASHGGPLAVLVSMGALGLGVMLAVLALMLKLVHRGSYAPGAEQMPAPVPVPAPAQVPDEAPEALPDAGAAQEPGGPEKEGTCPKCGAAYEPGQRFCGGCGAELSTLPKARRCAACGFELEEGDAFCPVCGAKSEG